MIVARTILLIDFEPEDAAGKVAGALEKELGLSTDIMRAEQPRVRTRGRQSSAEDLLSEVCRLRAVRRSDCALGFTASDLYVPELNFVFGLASVEHGCALVATPRLRSSDNTVYMQRLVKESIHEVGHVLGLAHCSNEYCVMHFSNTLADTDLKDSSFCARCWARLWSQGRGSPPRPQSP